MLAIRFEIDDEYNVFKKKILDGIDIDCFNWKVTENEILFDNRKIDFSNSWFDEHRMKKFFLVIIIIWFF